MINFVLILLVFIEFSNCVHNLATIPNINVNNDTLTITSFQYNPNAATSEWVDRIFGTKSIFYPNRSYREILSNKELSHDEIIGRSTKVKDIFELPTYGYWPFCSVELLGFALIDIEDPLRESFRTTLPSFGRSLLKLSAILKKSIPCFYRGLYENWRFYSTYTRPNYWAVVFYCPVQNKTTCTDLNSYVKRTNNHAVKFELVMELHRSKWKTSFTAKLQQHRRLQFNSTASYMKSSSILTNSLSFHKHHHTTQQYDSISSVGVCLAIPYVSSDATKSIANGAILFEWVQYYLKLGFKVMIYDRDGANKKYIFGKKFRGSQKVPNKLLREVVYHNYTIRGILDLSTRGLRYDNSEPKFETKEEADSRRRRFEAQGYFLLALLLTV